MSNLTHEERVEAYKARKEARIERMRARAERLQTVARENGQATASVG